MKNKNPPAATFRLEYADGSLSPCMGWKDLCAHAEEATRRGCRRAMFWLPLDMNNDPRGFWQELTLVVPGLVFENDLREQLACERDPDEPWAEQGTIFALEEHLPLDDEPA